MYKKFTIVRIVILIIMLQGVSVALFSQNGEYKRHAESDLLSDEQFQQAKSLVSRAEVYRGNEKENFFYHMQVIELQNNKEKSNTDLKVNVNQNEKDNSRNSLVQILSGNSKGNLILQKEVNMWFYKPGTSNPLRISPAQRFIGGASYSDVSATDYTLYYDPISMEEVTISKIAAYKLELVKIRSGVSYDKIIFYISQKKAAPIKSEFYTRSGKLVKTMYFRSFEQVKRFGTITTEWVIVDNINTKNITKIKIQKMGIETIPKNRFTPEGLIQ